MPEPKPEETKKANLMDKLSIVDSERVAIEITSGRKNKLSDEEIVKRINNYGGYLAEFTIDDLKK